MRTSRESEQATTTAEGNGAVLKAARWTHNEGLIKLCRFIEHPNILGAGPKVWQLLQRFSQVLVGRVPREGSPARAKGLQLLASECHPWPRKLATNALPQ